MRRSRRPARRRRTRRAVLTTASDSVAAEQRHHVGLRQRHDEHRRIVARHVLHEPAALDHEAHRVLERQHTREVGGDVLAEAVADERVGRDAPRHPLAGECDRRDEHRRQRSRGVPQLDVIPIDRDQRGEVEPDGVAHDVEAVAERGVEDVEAIVEAGRHPDVLRATAGEHERHTGRDVGRPVRWPCGRGPCRATGRRRRRRRWRPRCDGDASRGVR